jgi:hypothetical protein
VDGYSIGTDHRFRPLVRDGVTFAMIAGRLQPENVEPAVSQFDHDAL